MGQWLGRTGRDFSETDIPSFYSDTQTLRRHRRRRPLREIQILDSDSEDQDDTNADQIRSLTNISKLSSKKSSNRIFSKKCSQRKVSNIFNRNNANQHVDFISSLSRADSLNEFGLANNPTIPISSSSAALLNTTRPSKINKRSTNLDCDFNYLFEDSDEGIGLIEDKDLSEEENENDPQYDHSTASTKRDDKKILDADTSIEFPNNTQTLHEDSTVHSLPNSQNDSGHFDKNRYSKTQQVKQTHQQKKNYPTKRQTENDNFHILMRALARKYWQNSNSLTNTTLDAEADQTTCPTTNGGNTTRNDYDDDTFTSVTDLSRRENSLINDKPSSHQKVRTCANRMQPIVEESAQQDRYAIEGNFSGEQGITNRSEYPQRISADYSSPILDQADDQIAIADQDEEKHLNNDVDADLEDEFNYQSQKRTQSIEEVRGSQTSIADNARQIKSSTRPNRATVVKLSMPIEYVRDRMDRPGLKVFCYRFWVDDNSHTWSAFHCQKDRRIESIGRATGCHIRLKAKTRRQPSGFMKQEVVVYAPSLWALEKCCKLFDDKFPIFYASADFHKIKLSLNH